MLAPGFTPSMVLHVVKVFNNPHSHCVVPEMIKLYLQFINDMF